MAADHTDTGSVHKFIENHKCEKCDLVFNSKKSLRKHMIKEHVAVGKLACQFCEKTFKQAWAELSQAQPMLGLEGEMQFGLK